MYKLESQLLEETKDKVFAFIEDSSLSSREQFIAWCGDIKQVEGGVCYCLGDD